MRNEHVFESPETEAKVQRVIKQALNRNRIQLPPNGTWVYVLSTRGGNREFEDYVRTFLSEDKDISFTEMFDAIMEKAKELGTDPSVPEPGTIEQWRNNLMAVYKEVHGITKKRLSKEDYDKYIANPKTDQHVPNKRFRWGWLADGEKIKQAIENIKARSNPDKFGKHQRAANINATLVRFVRDFITNPSVKGALGAYNTAMRQEAVVVQTNINEQQPSNQQIQNLPLPHEMFQNKVNIFKMAKAVVPFITQINEHERRGRWRSVHTRLRGTLYGNLAYQILDHSDDWVLRTENLYTVRLIVKGRDDMPPNDDTVTFNYMVIDPTNRDQALEIVYRDTKTMNDIRKGGDYVFTKGKYKGKKMSEVGIRLPLEKKSWPVQAFWWTWDYEPDRMFLFPPPSNWKTGTFMTKEAMSVFIKTWTWTLDNGKVPLMSNYRTSKQMANELTNFYKNANDKMIRNIQTFQTTSGVARTNYVKSPLLPDWSVSMAIAAEKPSQKYEGFTEPLMVHNTKSHLLGHYKRDKLDEVLTRLNHIQEVQTSKSLEWESLFKTPIAEDTMEINPDFPWLTTEIYEQMIGDLDIPENEPPPTPPPEAARGKRSRVDIPGAPRKRGRA